MKQILVVLAFVLVAQAKPEVGLPFLEYGPPPATTLRPLPTQAKLLPMPTTTMRPVKPAIVYGPPTPAPTLPKLLPVHTTSTPPKIQTVYGPPTVRMVETTPKPTIPPHKPALVYGPPPTVRVVPKTTPKPFVPPPTPALVYGPPPTVRIVPRTTPKPTIPPTKPALVYGPPPTVRVVPRTTPKPTIPPTKPALVYGPPPTVRYVPKTTPKPTIPPPKPALVYGPPPTVRIVPKTTPKPIHPPHKPSLVYGPPSTVKPVVREMPTTPLPIVPQHKPALVYGPPVTGGHMGPHVSGAIPLPEFPKGLEGHDIETQPLITKVTTVVQLPAAFGEQYFPAGTNGFTKPTVGTPELLPPSKKVEIVVKPGFAIRNVGVSHPFMHPQQVQSAGSFVRSGIDSAQVAHNAFPSPDFQALNSLFGVSNLHGSALNAGHFEATKVHSTVSHHSDHFTAPGSHNSEVVSHHNFAANNMNSHDSHHGPIELPHFVTEHVSQAKSNSFVHREGMPIVKPFPYPEKKPVVKTFPYPEKKPVVKPLPYPPATTQKPRTTVKLITLPTLPTFPYPKATTPKPQIRITYPYAAPTTPKPQTRVTYPYVAATTPKPTTKFIAPPTLKPRPY